MKKCKQCGDQITGRADKQFCTDQCRYLFNNKLKIVKDEKIIKVNSILRKNRTILKKINPFGKTTVRKEVLRAEKFNFCYYTHIYKTKDNNIYFFCYEYGYRVLPENRILIINWQSYMSPQNNLCYNKS